MLIHTKTYRTRIYIEEIEKLDFWDELCISNLKNRRIWIIEKPENEVVDDFSFGLHVDNKKDCSGSPNSLMFSLLSY